MSNDKVPVPAQDVQALRSYKPFLQLGQVVAMPGVLDHLAKHAVFPAASPAWRLGQRRPGRRQGQRPGCPVGSQGDQLVHRGGCGYLGHHRRRER